MENDIIVAHRYCINHKEKLINDQKCGCFFCLKIFNPKEITDWIEDRYDKTALCPNCGIDSVIGEYTGFPITYEFLKKMKKYWF